MVAFFQAECHFKWITRQGCDGKQLARAISMRRRRHFIRREFSRSHSNWSVLGGPQRILTPGLHFVLVFFSIQCFAKFNNLYLRSTAFGIREILFLIWPYFPVSSITVQCFSCVRRDPGHRSILDTVKTGGAPHLGPLHPECENAYTNVSPQLSSTSRHWRKSWQGLSDS